MIQQIYIYVFLDHQILYKKVLLTTDSLGSWTRAPERPARSDHPRTSGPACWWSWRSEEKGPHTSSLFTPCVCRCSSATIISVCSYDAFTLPARCWCIWWSCRRPGCVRTALWRPALSARCCGGLRRRSAPLWESEGVIHTAKFRQKYQWRRTSTCTGPLALG